MCIYFTPVELLAVSLFDGLLSEILLFPNAYGRKLRLGHDCVIFCPHVLTYITATLCTPETMEHPAASGQLLLINDNVVLPVLCTDTLIMMAK